MPNQLYLVFIGGPFDGVSIPMVYSPTATAANLGHPTYWMGTDPDTALTVYNAHPGGLDVDFFGFIQCFGATQFNATATVWTRRPGTIDPFDPGASYGYSIYTLAPLGFAGGTLLALGTGYDATTCEPFYGDADPGTGPEAPYYKWLGSGAADIPNSVMKLVVSE